MLDFNFDDLSKTSKETIQNIAQIVSRQELRGPSEDLILAELINLSNADSQLERSYQDLQKKNEFLRQVNENLDAIVQKTTDYRQDLGEQKKDYVAFKRDIEDRISDILEPKNNEYAYQINVLNVKSSLNSFF